MGWNNSSSMDYIFREIRLPKTITAVIAGCCLSVAGLILQVIFRNPLAGPYVLGISSGASLMVALTVLAGNSWWWMHELAQGKSLKILAAIAGSVAVTLLILAVSKKITSNVILLLVGLMFSQLCGALESALEYFADPGNLKSFVVWGMGSLGSTTLSDTRVFGGVALVTLLAVLMFVKPLNALLMGEQYARNLGISYSKSRFYLILLSSVLTGICTAFCGPIAFVGIAVPILSRMLFKSSNQLLHVVTGMLLGSSILLFADAISHRLLGYATLPVNMITTFVGAPLVMYLMFKNKQW
jgi:iron complex transport system permease protein